MVFSLYKEANEIWRNENENLAVVAVVIESTSLPVPVAVRFQALSRLQHVLKSINDQRFMHIKSLLTANHTYTRIQNSINNAHTHTHTQLLPLLLLLPLKRYEKKVKKTKSFTFFGRSRHEMIFVVWHFSTGTGAGNRI